MAGTNKVRLGIAGAGKLGQALGRLLREAGERVVAIASRTPGHARDGAVFIGDGVAPVSFEALPECADRVLITVADDAIEAVARKLARAGFRDGIALHCCGALGPEVLEPLAARGVSCGVLHPLQTIPSPERGLKALWGIAWGVTAEGPAAVWAGEIVALLGGTVLRIAAESRALYHAAGCTACNYFVALEDAATSMIEAAGVDREQALGALEAMVETTRRNIFELGPDDALTGPILRGDADTLRRHLQALAPLPEKIRQLYRAAGQQTVEIARRRGLAEDRAAQLEELLRDNGSRNG